MKNIVIFGAGGHSLVVIDLIKELKEYTIIGMYDDNKEGEFDGIPILGQIDSNTIKKADEYIIGIGDDSTRKKIYEQFYSQPWATLVQPRSIVSKSVKINEGTVVLAGAIIQAGVVIGKHCIINTNSNIDHESNINSFSSIFKHCIDVYRGSLTDTDYDFWAVIFLDKNGDELFRKDADKNEISGLLTKEGDFVNIWREFNTTSKPAEWVVWLHTESKGWGEKITGKL